MKTDFLSLKQKDAIKGAVVAVLTAVLTFIGQSLDAGELTFRWKSIATIALSALVAYLIKNFFSDSIKQANLTLDKQGFTRVLSAEEIKAKENEKKRLL